jgi:hypothetical protein
VNIKFWPKNPNVLDDLGDQCMDGKIILKLKNMVASIKDGGWP